MGDFYDSLAASKVTRQDDVTTTSLTIQPGKIFGFVITVTELLVGVTATITITNISGTELWKILMLRTGKFIVDIPFIASDGLVFTGSGTRSDRAAVTVFHSHEGE